MTLTGTVKLLTGFIEYLEPSISEKISQIKNISDFIIEKMNKSPHWDLNIAIMLSPIYLLLLPEHIREHKISTLQDPSLNKSIDESQEVFINLLNNVPQLETVKQILLLKKSSYIELKSSLDKDDDPIILYSHILKISEYFYENLSSDIGQANLISDMRKDNAQFSSVIVNYLSAYSPPQLNKEIIEMRISEVTEGMTIAQEITTSMGVTLVKTNMVINAVILTRLSNYMGSGLITDSIQVFK